jgi:nucleotide-binding universal stress UspA family protein
LFQRIVVPLDGSARAERAIPVAARIARASGASVMLLQVVGTPTEYGIYAPQSLTLAEEIMQVKRDAATDYLATLMRLEDLDGVVVTTRVLSGPATGSILDVVNEEHVDLIVMCSHGYTGFTRFVLGSTAQQIARHSPVPVFILRDGGVTPTCSYPDPLRPLRAVMGLVALDGSAVAEAALEPAAQLVAALAAPAHGILLLTRVVKLPTIEREHALYEARAYLCDVAARLSRSDITRLHLGIATSVAVGKDVADALIGVAENGEDAEGAIGLGKCDLMVMRTHGREGVQRWVLGSVTERVLGTTRLPLLIMRAQEQPTTAQQPATEEAKVHKTPA